MSCETCLLDQLSQDLGDLFAQPNGVETCLLDQLSSEFRDLFTEPNELWDLFARPTIIEIWETCLFNQMVGTLVAQLIGRSLFGRLVAQPK